MMISKFRNSEYLRNSTVLIVGTALVQIIPVLLQPILRRIYSDVDFGNFAIYYSIVSVLAIVANLRYANSIVIPKQDKSAVSILAGSLLLNVLFAILVYIVLLIFGRQLFEHYKVSENLIANFWIFPLGVFLISSNLAFNFWLTRKKKFKGIVLNKGARRITEGGFQFSFAGLRKGGLIYGSLIGDFINLLVFVFQFRKSEGSFKGIKKNDITSSLKEQKEFPKYSLAPALLDVISVNLPVFVISAYFSKSVVGQFDGSRQLLALPLALISVSLSQVLFQKIVELQNQNKPVLPIIKANFLVLGLLGIVGTLIVYFFGVDICTLILGKNYVLAGEISSILIFSFAVRFIVSPLSSLFIATKKLKISAVWQIIYFASMLCLVFFRNLDIKEFIFYFVIIDVIIYALYAVLIFITAKKIDKVSASMP